MDQQTFPRVRKSQLGYKPSEVDAFLLRARRAFEGRDADGLGAESIRRTAFGMQKGGYSTQHVDSALERLEDAFAAQERSEISRLHGNEAWLAEARTTAQVIANRLARPEGRRFDRVGGLAQGYSTKAVDAFAERLSSYFRNGRHLAVDDVRTVVFPAQRGGYRESQVDLVLDAVVDVMLAVR
ncbi:DivIVA domain-containing protein [Agromyces archimandritae]|uniref:DivIVA domain-containing protein n=1 Tax=Agromyces archimandritae TaxID=2781962 RepID=A0A975FNY3_9MICO|nr:DivIVA domain-containing protein [Agromyces archimandritae]QTX04501.1 DivIVA domain-containing protein [Agromyces archimandritae]